MLQPKIPIVNQIEDLVRDVPGWSPIDELQTLFNLVYLSSDLPGDILEIGSWCGRCSVVLGMAARMIGNTRLQCIDLFPAKDDWKRNPDGSYSLQVNIEGRIYHAYETQTVFREPFERDIAPRYERNTEIYQLFCEIIARNDLQDVVSAYKGTSALFLGTPVGRSFSCKLAFIDGDHSYEAVCQDIHNAGRFLVEGGWICFDDAFSHYEGINRAIEELVVNNPAYELGQQMTRKFFIARKKRHIER